MFAAVAVTAAVIGFLIRPAAGILSLLSSAAFGAAFYAFTRARYQKIAEVSEQIDLVLHHADRIFIGGSDEGELSILQSEVTKMTLRLREQNDALKQEKAHLADSLADIAHQLRTPLTSLNLVLSLLANQPDAGERKALLREAEELLTQMDWLLTSLLKLSRLDAGIVVFQSERVDVASLVDAALRPLQIPMELHDVSLRVDAPEGIEIWGDAGWLSEALRNILKNCMESAGDHGKIEVVCEDNPLYAGIVIHDTAPPLRQVLPRERHKRRRLRDRTGPLQDDHLAARRDGNRREPPAGRRGLFDPFSKVTDLSPESHRDVSQMFYDMGKPWERRLPSWSF